MFRVAKGRSNRKQPGLNCVLDPDVRTLPPEPHAGFAPVWPPVRQQRHHPTILNSTGLPETTMRETSHRGE